MTMRRTISTVAKFDVSLRDGIQSAKHPELYTTETKQRILKTIIERHAPEAIEVGSFVSPRVLPIMADTEAVLEYGLKYAEKIGVPQNYYVLIPNTEQMVRAMKSPVINTHFKKYESTVNFSFVTSVSESFQRKNVRKSLEDTKYELNVLTNWMTHMWPTTMTKLYVSCINECPIEGKIDNFKVVKEIAEYNSLCEFDEICLSDTMGSLMPYDLSQILSALSRIPHLNGGKLSLHLHGFPGETRVRDLLKVAYAHNVRQLDVSAIDEGGCSVTMNKTKPNLTYGDIEQTLLLL